MVLPFLAPLIGAAATGIGSAISNREEADNERAQIKAANKATRKAVKRAEGYRRSAADVFGDTMAGLDRAPEMFQNLRDANVGYYQAAAPTEAEYGSFLPSYANPVSQMAGKSGLGRVMSENADESRRFAGLQSYGLATDLSAEKLAESRRRLEQISDFAARMMALTPLNRQVAMDNATKTSSGLGDMLLAGGALIGNSAGRGTPTIRSADPWAGLRL